MDAIISYLPFLMWVGFVLRMYWHFINADYPFTLKSPEGKKNINKAVFSALVVGVFFAFFLTIKMDDAFDTTGWTGIVLLIVFIVFYLGWGWFSDKLFLKLMDKFSQKSDEVIDKTVANKLPGAQLPDDNSK